MGQLVIGSHLGHMDHETAKFKIFGDRKKSVNRTLTLGIEKADQAAQGNREVSWETVSEGTGVHQCWSLFKHHLLKAQEEAIPKCRKACRQGRQLM